MTDCTASRALLNGAIDSLTRQWQITAPEAAVAMISAAESCELTIADLAALVYAADDQRRLIDSKPPRRFSSRPAGVVAIAS